MKGLCKCQSLLKNQTKIRYNKVLPTALFFKRSYVYARRNIVRIINNVSVLLDIWCPTYRGNCESITKQAMCTCNVTLTIVRVNISAVEKQQTLHVLMQSASALLYSVVIICGLSGSTIFSHIIS